MFVSKKDVDWRSGLGVGVSDSTGSIAGDISLVVVDASTSSSLSWMAMSDMPEIDVAGDSWSIGCEKSSSSQSLSDSEKESDRGGVMVSRT